MIKYEKISIDERRNYKAISITFLKHFKLEVHLLRGRFKINFIIDFWNDRRKNIRGYKNEK